MQPSLAFLCSIEVPYAWVTGVHYLLYLAERDELVKDSSVSASAFHHASLIPLPYNHEKS